MMAQAGAILISLGRKPGRETNNRKDRWYGDTSVEIIIMTGGEDVPANSPVKPSSATILLITLRVDEETLVETERTKEDGQHETKAIIK